MSDAPLKSYEFRREREPAWRELETLLAKAERSDVRRLSASDLARLPVLHRAALSSLSVARAISLDRNVVAYLEGLCVRAYGVVYAARRPVFEAVGAFLRVRFPRAVRANAGPLLLAVLATLLGTGAGWALCAADSERYYAFVPYELAGGRDPAATTSFLRDMLYRDEHGAGALAFFASFLFQHNTQVGILCFALGFLAGLPTFLLLFSNGLMLGAIAWLYDSRGLSLDLWGWLLPHGVPELTAIMVCGGAGLVVARHLLFPGRLGRLESLAVHGREAGVLVMGAILLLFAAGLIEGVFRQVVTSVPARYAVAASGFALLGWWLGFCGRERRT